MECLCDELITRIENGDIPYLQGEALRPIEQLPYINVVVEEAPVSSTGADSFWECLSRHLPQGRKFGIGLTVISQQVTAIDQGILTQLNTEITMALGNRERRCHPQCLV